jgi:hypothetical protein
VVDPRQADHLSIAAPPLPRQLLDRPVEIEQQRPRGVVADHRLDPEEARQPDPARHWGDAVEARCEVQHHVARGELDDLAAAWPHDDQFAVIFGERFIKAMAA